MSAVHFRSPQVIVDEVALGSMDLLRLVTLVSIRFAHEIGWLRTAMFCRVLPSTQVRDIY